MRSLDDDLGHKSLALDLIVSMKWDALDSAFLATVDIVYHKDLISLMCEVGIYFHVGIAFSLKVVDQIVLALRNQVLINGPLGIDGNQLLPLPLRLKRNG